MVERRRQPLRKRILHAAKMGVDVDPAGGLYGAGQFGYSINSASAAVQEAAAAATSASITL